MKSIYLAIIFSSACIYLNFTYLSSKVSRYCLVSLIFYFDSFFFFVKKTIFEENYFPFKNIPSRIFRYVNIQTVYFPHKKSEKNL